MLKITTNQTELLTKITQKTTTPKRLLFRATIVLAASKKASINSIAIQQNTSRDAVFRWTKRWRQNLTELDRLETEYTSNNLSASMYMTALAEVLSDAPRSGHPPTITEEQKQQIIALASEEPEKANVPITHWTCGALRDAILNKGILPTISSTHVGRFLKASHAQTTPQ